MASIHVILSAAAVLAVTCKEEVPTYNKHLRRPWQAPRESNRTVTMDSLATTLEQALHEGDASGPSSFHEVETSLAPVFAALPKNRYGNLDHLAFNYVVHRHFASRMGIHINGMGAELEDSADADVALFENHPEMRDVKVLQRKAPAMLEALLEHREHGRGLSFADASAMVSTLTQLLTDENTRLLASAFEVNGHDTRTSMLTFEDVEELMIIFFVLARDGLDGRGGDTLDARVVQWLAEKRRTGTSMINKVMFFLDTANNWVYLNRGGINPFRPKALSYDALALVLQMFQKMYPPVQNMDCLQMKDYMVALDPKGSGRVPLSIFYDQPDKHIFRFSEPLDYLAKIGALDMSKPEAPGVVISNYVLGPANCFRSTSLYTHCCLSECEVLMAEVERVAKGPFAAPRMLLEHVSNFSTGTVDGPRQLPAALVAKLESVAERHGGTVPLHGRLFAQWLHFAFPAECPYPMGKTTPATENVAHEYLAAASAPIEPSLDSWTDEEVLLVEPSKGRGLLSTIASWVCLAVSVTLVLRILVQHVQSASSIFRQLRGAGSREKLPTWHHAD